MQIIDIFNDDAFSVVELGMSINVIPTKYGRIGQLGLFPNRGILTPDVAIEIDTTITNLLQSSRRGAPGTAGTKGKRSARSVPTIHVPHGTQLTADDLRKRRGRDGQISLASAQAEIAREQRAHRRKHDITLEHLRAGALRGVILDADGSVILNLFTEFGVTETEFDFKLGTANEDLRVTSLQVATHMDEHLEGETLTGVRGLASQTWFEGFIKHESVKRAWDNHNSSSDKLGNDPRRGFFFGGITYEQYKGKGSFLEEDNTTTIREFIPEGDVRFMPEGMEDSAATFNAPSDFMEDIGEEGEPFYMKLAPDPKLNRYVDVHSQMNPLPFCSRPKLLVRGHSTTGL